MFVLCACCRQHSPKTAQVVTACICRVVVRCGGKPDRSPANGQHCWTIVPFRPSALVRCCVCTTYIHQIVIKAKTVDAGGGALKTNFGFYAWYSAAQMWNIFTQHHCAACVGRPLLTMVICAWSRGIRNPAAAGCWCTKSKS